jgi:hypothetical protein
MRGNIYRDKLNIQKRKKLMKNKQMEDKVANDNKNKETVENVEKHEKVDKITSLQLTSHIKPIKSTLDVVSPLPIINNNTHDILKVSENKSAKNVIQAPINHIKIDEDHHDDNISIRTLFTGLFGTTDRILSDYEYKNLAMNEDMEEILDNNDDIKTPDDVKILLVSTTTNMNSFDIYKYLRNKKYNARLMILSTDTRKHLHNLGGVHIMDVDAENISQSVNAIKYVVSNDFGNPSIIICDDNMVPYTFRNLYPQSYIVYMATGRVSYDLTSLYDNISIDSIMGTENVLYRVSNYERLAISSSNKIVFSTSLARELYTKMHPNSVDKQYSENVLTSNHITTLEHLPTFKLFDILIVINDSRNKTENLMFMTKLVANKNLTKYSKCILYNGHVSHFESCNVTYVSDLKYPDRIYYISQSKSLLVLSTYDSDPQIIHEALNVNCIPLMSKYIGRSESLPDDLVCDDFKMETWVNKIRNVIENYAEYTDLISKLEFNELDTVDNLIENIKEEIYNTDA